MELTEKDIRKLTIKMGVIKKINRLIKTVRYNVSFSCQHYVQCCVDIHCKNWGVNFIPRECEHHLKWPSYQWYEANIE